ncbi:lethal(2)neighbour of Tid protein [Linepithema humile]|uniref:lethal(2)neighbour of Tid protein n=1 Tax=Linepithema humile TaxID=83485 RepID=UPI0006234808|nr:PREDICTED: lethal(2)neighbour of tid protein [Linepithema humile]
MAPRRESRSNVNTGKSSIKNNKNWIRKYLEWRELVSLLTDPKKFALTAKLFLVFEVVLNVLVIENVPYTEIDWKAYMQEVEGFLNGTMDYSKLRGDTGPLVYPAGFVYAFSGLYYITSNGTHIKLAQYIFAALYLVLLTLVFRIYARTKKVPPYILILMCCTSHRIHSIFVLRLFNDPLAMVLLYMSINWFLDDKWYLGSIFYSLAVSVKMNILLFAPALLIAYLCNLGTFKTLIHLSICAFVQLLLGLPFLLENSVAYIKGAFNLGRVFEFRWTVNWRFLSEDTFIHPYFHISLLLLQALVLLHCAPTWITYMKSYAKLKQVERDLKPQFHKKEKVDMSVASQLFIYPLFVANFIGIMFSRSLHYQFYIWYYHALPYIAWCTDYKTVLKLAILGVIELCWNTYPSTVFSSVALHACHIKLLYGILKNRPNTVTNATKDKHAIANCKDT